MDSDNEQYEICTSPDMVQGAQVRSLKVLPEKSRKQYEQVYKTFMDWRVQKKVNSFSESVLMGYFDELSEKYKSPSLWATYSMLRSTLTLNNGINIETYLKLKALLKRKSVGYQPKKARTFTADQINQFLNKAPDEVYLATKVVLIMGVIGACRSHELHNMKIQDVQDLGSVLLIRVPDTRTKRVRRFTITEHFYKICKSYMNLRPNNTESNSFFLSYYNGKVRTQKIGINKFSAMVKQIATFLKLANPETYTGRSFRRSSATLQVDAGGHIIALKRHGGWRSTLVTEEYMEDPFIHSTTQNASQSSIKMGKPNRERKKVSKAFGIKKSWRKNLKQYRKNVVAKQKSPLNTEEFTERESAENQPNASQNENSSLDLNTEIQLTSQSVKFEEILLMEKMTGGEGDFVNGLDGRRIVVKGEIIIQTLLIIKIVIYQLINWVNSKK